MPNKATKVQTRIDLREMISPAFYRALLDRSRYLVMKGSRGSGKSKFSALKMILVMMKYPLMHGLCVRAYFTQLKNSCYSDLQWAVRRLHVENLWQFSRGELKATYIPTGQTILFKGLMDDPTTVTSISVPFGYLGIIWLEEATQIGSEDAFETLDESLRAGAPEGTEDNPFPDGGYRQIMVSFNPWSAKHWLKKRFFDAPDKSTYAFTTTYRDNPWLLQEDKDRLEDERTRNPRRARVVCDGDWGISTGLIYENWQVEDFDPNAIRNQVTDNYEYYYTDYFGLDFGYSNDPTAFVAILCSPQKKRIYIYDEIYKYHLKNIDIVREICKKGYGDMIITADSAEVKSIATMKAGIWDGAGSKYSLPLIRPSRKGAGSILAGIAKIQDYQIIISPHCENTINELSTYAWEIDRKTGAPTDHPVDADNHAMDAMRYALEGVGENGMSFLDDTKPVDNGGFSFLE